MSKKSYKINLSDELAQKFLGKVNKGGKYRVSAEQREKINQWKIENGSEMQKLKLKTLGIPEKKLNVVANSTHYWDKSDPKYSIFVKNPYYEEKQMQPIYDRFEEIVNKHQGEKRKIKTKEKPVKKALKATTSDDHIGLDPNPKNNSLFQYEYNGDIYQKSLDKVFKSIVKEYDTHGKFDMVLLDNLGDEQDGWNGFTTRRGHELDQNMSNVDVFDVCVDAKVNMIRNVAEAGITDKIIIRKCVNDNHSGDFGHIINKAVMKIINMIYDSDFVQIETLTRFMEHRVYGNHAFILTHGKDKDKMFKGLPLILNDKTIEFVNGYIDFYNINQKYIHVEKGDLHQLGFQKARKFDYRNFMSFAPPSAWVQHNFGPAYSGYSIQVIPKHNNEISHTDYFLDYTKKR